MAAPMSAPFLPPKIAPRPAPAADEPPMTIAVFCHVRCDPRSTRVDVLRGARVVTVRGAGATYGSGAATGRTVSARYGIAAGTAYAEAAYGSFTSSIRSFTGRARW